MPAQPLLCQFRRGERSDLAETGDQVGLFDLEDINREIGEAGIGGGLGVLQQISFAEFLVIFVRDSVDDAGQRDAGRCQSGFGGGGIVGDQQRGSGVLGEVLGVLGQIAQEQNDPSRAEFRHADERDEGLAAGRGGPKAGGCREMNEVLDFGGGHFGATLRKDRATVASTFSGERDYTAGLS